MVLDKANQKMLGADNIRPNAGSAMKLPVFGKEKIKKRSI
jgi:hypothetical protein